MKQLRRILVARDPDGNDNAVEYMVNVVENLRDIQDLFNDQELVKFMNEKIEQETRKQHAYYRVRLIKAG